MHARTATAMALSVIAVLAFTLEVASWNATGSVGGQLHLRGSCAVQFVATSQEEARAGIQPGDAVDLRKASRLFRADILPQIATPTAFSGAADDAVVIPVVRGGRTIVFTEKLRQHGSLSTFIAQVGFKIFFLLVGVFVLFRGKDRASLILGVWCIVITSTLPGAWFGLLPPAARVGFAMAAAVLFTTAPLLLYLIIEAVVKGLMPSRVVWLTRVALLAFLLPAVLDLTVNMLAQIQSGCGVWAIRGIEQPLLILNQLIILGFFVAAYMQSRGMQRLRIRWVFWAFLISRFGIVLFWINRYIAHPINLTGVEWLTVMIFPVGTAYAVLKHRIIDVSFVLNRALLYTAFSTLTVGLLALLEYVLNGFAVSRGIGLAVNVLVALGIGLSFHALRERLHSWINRLLFRRKHDTTVALNRFVEEAPFIQNPGTLVARASDEIRLGMATEDVRFYQVYGDGYHRMDSIAKPADEVVDADDPAFLKLRSSHQDVDLSDVSSALGAVGYAFPLSVRGESFGALVCGRRADDEGYAPDERHLLRHVAREVAAELFIIRSRDQRELLQAMATGLIDPDKARDRAQELIDRN